MVVGMRGMIVGMGAELLTMESLVYLVFMEIQAEIDRTRKPILALRFLSQTLSSSASGAEASPLYLSLPSLSCDPLPQLEYSPHLDLTALSSNLHYTHRHYRQGTGHGCEQSTSLQLRAGPMEES
jgi:hypothetical protein